jgi:PIN domain nuclease of toxin-antitoxin system
MRVLLDTHAWIWLQDRPERFSARTMDVLQDPETDRLVSLVTIWELAVKLALGKVRVPGLLDEYIPSRLELTMARTLPIDVRHAVRVATLPMHHRDPFDRLLIAQAQIERLAIVTADRRFAAYGVELLPL